MLRHWFPKLGLVLILRQPVPAQEAPGPPDPEEGAIRLVVEQYHRAVRNADVAGVKAVIIPGSRGTSPGGTGAGALTLLRSATPWKGRTTLLRRIAVLSSTVAAVTGVWRSFDAPAPFDTGTFQYTLLHGDGGWKITYAHEAFLPGPAERRIAAIEPDPQAGTDANGWITLFDGKNLEAWVSAAVGSEVGSSWRIDDGSVMPIPKGARAGLLTRDLYRFFELRFEWLAAPVRIRE
ncbi:MAG: DUF1080 domain-containing protein [Acidobacteria bacterium]|nr:DUF1080 domain-containing protein [Acidobacteriota bacterium]